MSAWVLAGIVLTGAWTQLDEIGWIAAVPLAIVYGLDRAARVVPPAARGRPPGRQAGTGHQEAAPVIAAAILCGLHIAHVLLTAREEFAFGGDEGYHLSATRAFALYYLRAAPLLALAVAVFAVGRWRQWPFAATAAMAALIASSFLLPASALFGRYPTGFYHLSAPFNVAFDVAGIPYPSTANHLVNVLSLPAWLFVLRPLVIGRHPDWQVLPIALLVYFQAPSFVYVGSALLEPWAFVFLLLALEALVALPPDDRWFAVLLASVATFFKETAVLLLPTIWLLACVNWNGFRPSLRPHALTAGIAAVTPFAVYFAVRIEAEVLRTVAVAAAGDVWTPERIARWFSNVRAQLGLPAVAAVAPTFFVALRHPLWALTAVLLAVFFFVDALSIPYTGYGRFLAYSLLALCGALFAVAYRANRRHLVAAAMAIAVLQVVPVSRTLALDFRPDYERNSLEWNRGPIRLPIRTLIERLPSAPGGAPRAIRVVTSPTDLTSLHVAYPDLANQYELRRAEGSASECACRDNNEAVLGVFEWPAHLGDTNEARSLFEDFGAACVRQIEATCRAIELERDRRGAAVGAIGVGVR
jgi:hypothetical protein